MIDVVVGDLFWGADIAGEIGQLDNVNTCPIRRAVNRYGVAY